MGTITIKNLIGGSINITTTGGGSEPAGHEKTWIWFDGQENYEEFDWSGEMTQEKLIDFELFDENDWGWSRNPVKVEIGTKVTSIGEFLFNNCTSLTSITIPNSVENIGQDALGYCDNLTSASILGFTQEQIVANASAWYLGYKYNDDWSELITFPVTVTASDGTFILHQS